jgi:hypothetical protein
MCFEPGLAVVWRCVVPWVPRRRGVCRQPAAEGLGSNHPVVEIAAGGALPAGASGAVEVAVKDCGRAADWALRRGDGPGLWPCLFGARERFSVAGCGVPLVRYHSGAEEFQGVGAVADEVTRYLIGGAGEVDGTASAVGRHPRGGSLMEGGHSDGVSGIHDHLPAPSFANVLGARPHVPDRLGMRSGARRLLGAADCSCIDTSVESVAM